MSGLQGGAAVTLYCKCDTCGKFRQAERDSDHTGSYGYEVPQGWFNSALDGGNVICNTCKIEYLKLLDRQREERKAMLSKPVPIPKGKPSKRFVVGVKK